MVFTKAAGRGGEHDKKCESVAGRESNPIAFAPVDFAGPWHGRGCFSCAEIAAPSSGEGLTAQKSPRPALGRASLRRNRHAQLRGRRNRRAQPELMSWTLGFLRG